VVSNITLKILVSQKQVKKEWNYLRQKKTGYDPCKSCKADDVKTEANKPK
jgi:hypothetical protein